jgi:TrbL/VirB6 plasmid conjugal transfer protein
MITISDLVPNLQPMVEDLSQQLRFICYFILTAAIVVRTGRGGNSIGQLARPIVTNIIICGIISTLPMWFNLIRDEFWTIAVSIRKEFTGSVDGTGAALMQLIQPPDTGVNWLDVGNSIMKAVQYALGWLIVWIGGLIQLPMMIVQYVMECLCYLFLPIAICLLAFESTKGLAIRYIQQTLAILAWPIGFAVVDLVGFTMLDNLGSSVSAGALAAGLATGFTPVKLVIGGIVAIWLILGSLVTPIVMQMLFCSGAPMSSAVGASIQMGIGFAGAGRFLKTGGGGAGAPTSGAPPTASANTATPPTPPPSSPPSPLSPYSPRGPLAPSSGSLASPSSSVTPLSPLPSGLQGLVQSARGSLAIGSVADRISPSQAQSFANQSGTPFTQAFSNGSVMTHQPAVSRVPPASTFLAPLTPNPAFA